MKKIISLILVLMLCVSLGACGESTPNINAENSTSTSVTTTAETNDTPLVSITTTTDSENISASINTQATETTSNDNVPQVDKKLKDRYKKAIMYLEQYKTDGFFMDEDTWEMLYDNDALEYLYEEFKACGDYENCKEILSNFIIYPDKLADITLSRTDKLGNITESTYISYIYSEKGICINEESFLDFLGWNFSDYFKHVFEYDEDRLIGIKGIGKGGLMFQKDFVYYSIYFEYDTNGNIIKASRQSSNEEYVNIYTYDSENRLISAEKQKDETFSCSYSYDANGRLVGEECIGDSCSKKTKYLYNDNGYLEKKEIQYDNFGYKETSVVEYTYDVNGYLIKSFENYIAGETETIQKVITYTNDENGKPISAELIETENGKNKYASQILTYNYGIYFYNAE